MSKFLRRLTTGKKTTTNNTDLNEQTRSNSISERLDGDSASPVPPVKPLSKRPASLRAFQSDDLRAFEKDFNTFDNLILQLDEILDSNPSGIELSQNALANELIIEIERAQPQLLTMIQIASSTSDAAVLAPILALNDRGQVILEKYHIKLNAKDDNGGGAHIVEDDEQTTNPFDNMNHVESFPQSTTTNPFDDIDLVNLAFSNLNTSSSKRQPPPPQSLLQAPGQESNGDDEEDLL